MKVSLLHIRGCPHTDVAAARLAEALRRAGHAGHDVEQVLVTTHEEAQATRFVGSPTIRVDGLDLFPAPASAPYGITCRVYPSDGGAAGAPTVEEMVAALASRC